MFQRTFPDRRTAVGRPARFTCSSRLRAGGVRRVLCAAPRSNAAEKACSLAHSCGVDTSYSSFVITVAGRKKLNGEDVIQYPFILPPIGSITRKLLDKAFQETTGRTPEGSVETSSYTIIRKLLVGTRQVCFRSVSEFSHDLSDRQIVQLDVDFDLPSSRNLPFAEEGRCGDQRGVRRDQHNSSQRCLSLSGSSMACLYSPGE